MDRQEQREDRARTDEDADLRGIEPERQAVKRDQKREKFSAFSRFWVRRAVPALVCWTTDLGVRGSTPLGRANLFKQITPNKQISGKSAAKWAGFFLCARL
jgi:hypothetical protein